MTESTFKPTSCLVFDALEKLNLQPQVLSLDIRPLREEDVICGEIFTLKGISGVTDEQKKASRAFFDELQPGVVIMIETGDSYGVGHWGELMSIGAKTKKVQGVIVDGGCRDSREVQKMEMPVFCKYTSPFESGDKYCIGEWQVEIKLPGMAGGLIVCRPGDFVVADTDGIIVIPKDNVAAVLAMAEDIHNRERRAIADMQRGRPINESFIVNGVV